METINDTLIINLSRRKFTIFTYYDVVVFYITCILSTHNIKYQYYISIIHYIL